MFMLLGQKLKFFCGGPLLMILSQLLSQLIFKSNIPFIILSGSDCMGCV